MCRVCVRTVYKMKSYSCRSNITAIIKMRTRPFIQNIKNNIRIRVYKTMWCVDYHNFLCHDLCNANRYSFVCIINIRPLYNKIRGSNVCVCVCIKFQWIYTQQSKWKMLKSNSTDRWPIEMKEKKKNKKKHWKSKQHINWKQSIRVNIMPPFRYFCIILKKNDSICFEFAYFFLSFFPMNFLAFLRTG